MPHTIAIDARKIRDFGIGTYIRNLIRELAAIDHENRYVVLVGPAGRDVLQGLPPNFELLLWRAPVYSLGELFTLSWKLLRLRVDLFHATHYVLPFLLPCKAVVTIHDIIHLLFPEFLPNRLAFFYAERMIRRALEHGDRVLTVSANTKNDLTRYFGVDGAKIEVIHLGIEEAFRTPLSDEEIDQRLELYDIERGYVLFVGNPKPHKNLDNVVRAYARAVKTRGIPQNLVVVGERDSIEKRLRQLAGSLEIDDRIALLGHVPQEDLPALFQAAGLFLYPTLYEGFGLPVVEAMASGVPVITSNTSALKEVAAGHADLVNPLDIDAMAQAIARCLTDKEHHASLCRLGKLRADDFSWRRVAERTLATYQQALAGPPHPRS